MRKGKGGIDYGIDYSEWSYEKHRLSLDNHQKHSDDFIAYDYNDDHYIETNINQEQGYYNDRTLYSGGNYYNALPYAKSDKPRLKRSEIITAAALMLSGFLITILLTTFLAQGLNIGHLLGRLSKAEVKQKQYYAVQIGSYASESQALQASQTVRQLGGGGFILVDGSYRIIAAVYPEEEQALSVMANAGQYSPEKYVIVVPEIVLNFSNKQIKEITQKALSQWDDMYKRLYDHAIKLDKAQTTEAAVLLDIQRAYDDLNALLNEYTRITKDQTRVEHIYIKNGLKNILAALKTLLNARTEGNLSADIKYAYTKILIDYKDLANQLSR
ncbi:MAG TPA: SPOR domain-containing protein [Clostridia bacterium]